MALADFEIVEIVRRRDLHRARAELGVGILVADDRDAAADERQDDVLADKMLVALVLGMDGNRDVAEHGLGTGGGNGDGLVAALDRVAQVPHLAVGFDVLDLEVGDGGLETGVPVDQTLGAVDQALLV